MQIILERWKKFLLTEKKEETWRSSHVVLVDGDKILLLQRSSDDHWMPGKYAFPGGNKDGDEKLAVSLSREIEEETGLKVDPSNLFYMRDISEELNHAFYTCDTFSGKLNLNANGVLEHDDGKWVSVDAISSLETVPNIKKVVDAAIVILGETE